MCAWMLVIRMTCRAGRATANGTSCTLARATLCITLVWVFGWIALMRVVQTVIIARSGCLINRSCF
jgi:hypothetical protein